MVAATRSGQLASAELILENMDVRQRHAEAFDLASRVAKTLGEVLEYALRSDRRPHHFRIDRRAIGGSCAIRETCRLRLRAHAETAL